jgi:hypothetical protein
MPPVNRPRPGQKPRAQTPKKPSGSNSTATGIIIAVAVLALVAAGYFVGYPLLLKNSQPATAIIIEPPADTAVITPPVVEDIAVKQESSSSVPTGYYIIVGSFRNEANASRMVTNCSGDIQLQVLYFAETGFYRVSAGHYDSIHKAYNDTYSVKDLDGCANAWVLENR